MKYCPKCKNLLELNNFYKNQSQKFGVDVYCKECSKEKSKQYYKIHKKQYNKEEKRKYNLQYKNNNKNKIKEIQKRYNETLNCRYLDYKKSAITRKIEFNLSIQEFSTFWNSQCFYCGQNIKTIGIDRINNNIGYVINNCVSCCEICNRLKLDLDFESWIAKINQIIKFHKKKFKFGKNIDINCLKNNYSQYKYRARKKNLEFSLSKEQFITLLKSNCFYCGIIDYEISTIDRLHNNIGYVINNCVSCCKYCNSGKRDRDYEEFINWINQLIIFRSHEDVASIHQ